MADTCKVLLIGDGSVGKSSINPSSVAVVPPSVKDEVVAPRKVSVNACD